MEVVIELLVSHVCVTVDSLLVLEGGVGVVCNDLFNFVREDLLSIGLVATRVEPTRSLTVAILVLLKELLVHDFNLIFSERVFSLKHFLEVLVNVS